MVILIRSPKPETQNPLTEEQGPYSTLVSIYCEDCSSSFPKRSMVIYLGDFT